MARKKASAKAARNESTSSEPISSIPLPFEPAPERLNSWLSQLSKRRLYLTHLDVNPRALKRQVFVVPVILNLFFVAFITWRIWYIYPWYAQLAQQIWELRNMSSLNDLYKTGSIFGWIKHELRNCMTVAFDYALLLVVAPWPWSFFLERPGNPVSWRWKVGIRERELIVRISRGWDVNDLLHGEKKASESPFFVTRVFPAVQMDRISKTGYLLMDKDWDLDFYAMTEGQFEIDAKVDTKDLHEDGFNGKMFAFWKPSASSSDREGKWVMWDYRRDLYGKDKSGTASRYTEKEEVTEGRRAIERFQEKLTEMGKEELFFKWVELIHYESSKPGGFTKERQIDAGKKIKGLFEEYNVNFEQFEKDCGIVDGEFVD
jgi:hypothetical protein